MRVVCSVHPKYKGFKKPASKCICCETMWEYITNPRGYTTILGFDDKSSMRIISEKSIKTHICKDCNEPFIPTNKEKICADCKLEREIEKEELYESNK